MRGRREGTARRWAAIGLFGLAGALLANGAVAQGAPAGAVQDLKIGFVSSERILRESTPAKAAEQKLLQEFAKRDKELQDMGAQLKTLADKLEKDGPVLAEADLARRQREVQDADREFQRRQREFREDLNQRKNEELQSLLERAQKIVRQLAEQEKYDLIVQDAVYVGPRIDLTDRVLKSLNGAK
jgi:outer membrane protein